MKFEVSGCTTTKAYRPKFCGVCTDGRCCTPHRTTTLPVEFKCPDGQVMKKQMMFIKTCACHYNCPSENDIFESLYYKKMLGDTAWTRTVWVDRKENSVHLNQISISYHRTVLVLCLMSKFCFLVVFVCLFLLCICIIISNVSWWMSGALWP